MSESPFIVEINTDNFISEVIERSQQTPVLVDFWADWCGPCKSLMPILAKLADEFAGAFILAKIDTDAEQMLAAQFGIRSLPTVVLLKDGQPVDQFMGALPESGVREFLSKHIEPVTQANVADAPLAQIRVLLQQGQTDTAEQLVKQIIESEPDNVEAKILHANVKLANGDRDAANSCLESMDSDTQKLPAYKALRGKIAFSLVADDASNIDTLANEIEQDPTNHKARYQLAALLVMQGDFEASMKHLLQIVRLDRSFQDDAGRKGLIQIFDILGNDDPLVAKYRGKLATVLN